MKLSIICYKIIKFKNFAAIKLNSLFLFQDELQKDKPPPAESEMGIEVSPYKIGRKEVGIQAHHLHSYRIVLFCNAHYFFLFISGITFFLKLL